MQQGHPVIPSFVIPANSFWQFLQEINWSDPLLADFPNSDLHFNANDYEQLQAIAQSINHHIVSSNLPSELVSELESAINNFNTEVIIFQINLAYPHLETFGILEPIICLAKSEEFTEKIKEIWAQVFHAKSLLYWQNTHQIETQKLQPVVLVQPLQSAIASGQIQTFANHWKILTAHGLGISIDLGQTIPDYYIISAENCTIQEKRLGNKIIAYNFDSSTVKESYTNTWKEVYHTQFPTSDFLPALQAFLLPEELQKEFVLDEKKLQQLIKLSQDITSSINRNFFLKWSLFPNQEYGNDQLLIYDFQLLKEENKKLAKKPKFVTIQSQSITNPAIIKGIAASPGKATAPVQIINSFVPKLEEFSEGGILVTSAITPSYLPLVKKASGIISEQGGIISHAAILAREIGIPAVVGVTNATQIIKTDNFVLIDGNKGEISIIEAPDYSAQKYAQRAEKNSILHNSFPIATKLFVNLSQIDSIERVKNLPIDGVGLLRSELMAIQILENHHPLWWIQQGHESELIEQIVEKFSEFAAAFMPKPVFYRSLDLVLFNDHNPQQTFSKSSEHKDCEFCLLPHNKDQTSELILSHKNDYYNPILGRHGTFSYMLEPSLLDLEIKILSQVNKLGYSNINLILPFVRSVEELKFCRSRIEEKWEDKPSNFQLWIMAEVPSILFLLPEYVKAGVQGITIGSNDLTQLLLGIDREEKQMASAFNSCHPAVMRAIKHLIYEAKKEGIPCSICGDAPALHPEIIDDLIRWGITSISVNVDAIERTYNAIARAEQRLILEAARQNLS